MMRFNLGPMFASDLQLELGTIGESACFSAQKSRLPGRLPPAVVVVAVVCCFACVARSLKAAATAIVMQISTVKMPINIPIDTIGVSSNSACGPDEKPPAKGSGCRRPQTLALAHRCAGGSIM
uniref:Uncharacterized protein n=1 Tax=Anopheles merus TaxID=30066 RepID=A0A182UZN0_ANOME